MRHSSPTVQFRVKLESNKKLLTKVVPQLQNGQSQSEVGHYSQWYCEGTVLGIRSLLESANEGRGSGWAGTGY